MKLLNFRKALTAIITSVFLLGMTSALAGVAVIVHPSNTSSLSESDIARIFLGKKKSFPSGSEALPIDQNEGSDSRSAFVSTVLKKNDQQIKAYWAQLLFTGKGTPPKSVGGDAEVKQLVAENPNLIGYIDAGSVDASVKVVLEF